MAINTKRELRTFFFVLFCFHLRAYLRKHVRNLFSSWVHLHLKTLHLKTLHLKSLQVYRDVWSTPVSKPYMAHRVRGTVWGLHFCPFEDVLGVGHGDGFTSMLVPGPALHPIMPSYSRFDQINLYLIVLELQEAFIRGSSICVHKCYLTG